MSGEQSKIQFMIEYFGEIYIKGCAHVSSSTSGLITSPCSSAHSCSYRGRHQVNSLSVYMAGSLSIVELDLWGIQLMLNCGIVFFGSNDNPIASNRNLRPSGRAV